ncbi:MAG: hypothetical protein KF696_03560 [Planctomycetes bacterium]|nr:hypothetical protein [Planctomycetota bacterium]MCW8134046.1 hypothetical protein [Planctomycetota bacterium]
MAIRDAYHAELESFLFNPKANPFKKEEIDKRRAEEAKAKPEPTPDKPDKKDDTSREPGKDK